MLQPLLGLAVFILLAWAVSEHRQQSPWRTILAGLALQIGLAWMFLHLSLFRQLFALLNQAILALDTATQAGTAFVFGYLGGGSTPFEVTAPEASFVLAFRALPLVLVVSALSAVLFYWRILPVIVNAFSWALQRTMGIGGALGLSAAANLFIGMVEAPLVIRPYLAKLTRSELFAMMTCGMATIAGTVMVLYASILSGTIADSMGQILSASLISAPAALMIARIMIPETGQPTAGHLPRQQSVHSSMEAVTKGTLDGLQLFFSIIAMLIVFVALVHLVNQLLAVLPAVAEESLSLQRLLGWLMSPVAWLMGVPWSEAVTAGSLLGIKTILNELLAYLQLASLPENALSSRSELIMTYALCGFANLGSLGIMLGGLCTLVPERQAEIVNLGMRSILSGTLATCMTGTVIGFLTGIGGVG